jgi:hypothetical protein
MHCIGHAPAQLSALPRLSPEKLTPFETFGFWANGVSGYTEEEYASTA